MNFSPEILQRQRAYTGYGGARKMWGCRDDELLMDGPAGCVAGETRLFLADEKKHVSIKTLLDRGQAPVVLTVRGPVQASLPFLKGLTAIYRVTMKDGRTILVTADHKFLTPLGWKKLASLSAGCVLLLSGAFHLPSTSDICLSTSRQDALHLKEKGLKQGASSFSSPDDNILLHVHRRVEEDSSKHHMVQWGTVSSIQYVRTDSYYDLHVPKEEHYLAEGFWNHNTGKTRGILEKIHLCAMKYDRSRHLICRKTRESMTESVLVTFEEKVMPEDSYLLDGPQRNLRQRYNYDNGSVIVVGGMDKPSKIMSTEYDTVSFFEGTEFSEEDLEMVSTRLRNGRMPYQQILVDCNPGNPNHWLNKRPELDGPNGQKLMTRILSRHEDNPTLFDMKAQQWTEQGKRYLSRLDKLSGHRYLRLRKGLWVAAEGLVYDLWDPDIHLVKKFTIPPSWRKIRVVDFGYTNPFVCQWWALDEDDCAWLYREIYHTRRLVSDHAEQIKKLSGDERYEVTISDHDSESRATLHDCGIITHPAWKLIQPGIEAVTERLRLAGNQKPRLYVMQDCRVELDPQLLEDKLPTSTQEEYDSYMYPKGIDGKPNKEEPVDKDNHGMDATRYFVAYADNITGMVLNVTAEKAQVIGGGKK